MTASNAKNRVYRAELARRREQRAVRLFAAPYDRRRWKRAARLRRLNQRAAQIEISRAFKHVGNAFEGLAIAAREAVIKLGLSMDQMRDALHGRPGQVIFIGDDLGEDFPSFLQKREPSFVHAPPPLKPEVVKELQAPWPREDWTKGKRT